MRSTLQLPEEIKFDIVSGTSLTGIKDVTKIARVHPAIMEMGRRLLDTLSTQGNDPGKPEGGQYRLDDEMRPNAKLLQRSFISGLRRVARALWAGPALEVKSYRDEHKLVFWYELSDPTKPARRRAKKEKVKSR